MPYRSIYNKVLNFRCLNTEKQFELSHTFKPLTETSTGKLTYEDFKQLSTNLEEKAYCSVDNASSEPTK